MSIAVLGQVYDEVRRLSIAGSSVASGDFRLQKLIAPLEKSGEKAPVFKKVAEAVARLVDSTEKTSTEALLDLSTLVNAILYTQGETGAQGELEPIEQVGLGILPKHSPSSLLKSLAIALTEGGSGRLEVVQESLRRQPFPDPRLLAPSMDALEGSYHEVGEIVEKHILPQYGKSIVPIVREKYDLKGKASDARRLSLLHRIDPEGTKDLLHQALEEGSKEVKIEAISKLREPSDIPYLVEQTKAKAAAVRDAAYSALSEIPSPDAANVIVQGLTGTSALNHIRGGLKSRQPEVLDAIIAEIRKTKDKVLSASASQRKERAHLAACERLYGLLEALSERTDPQTEAVLLEIFPLRDEISKAEPKDCILNTESTILSQMSACSDKTREALIAQHETYDESGLGLAIQAALRVDNPTRFYDLFHPYIVNASKATTKKKEAKNKAGLVAQTIRTHVQYSSSYWTQTNASDEAVPKRPEKIDPRWLDMALKSDDLELVIALARPGHGKAHARLTAEMKKRLSSSKRPDYQISEVLAALIRSQHPQMVDLLIETLQVITKWGHTYYVYWVCNLIPELPKSAIPRLEAVLPDLPDALADHVVDALAELKNKTE